MHSRPISGRGLSAVVVVLVLLAALGGVVWFLTGTPPDEVDIDEAADGVAGRVAEDVSGDTDVTEDGSLDGTWTVDTSVGEFSVLDTTGTFVGFRIDEELARIGETEAVGRTPDVEGSITIEDGVLTAATVTADMTTIVSDESRRDDRIQQALETGTFPTATFELTEPVDLGEIGTGDVVAVDAVGSLTVHGVTQPVVVPLEATVRDGVAVVTGSVTLTFADHGVEVPTAPMVLSVDESGEVEFQLYLTRG